MNTGAKIAIGCGIAVLVAGMGVVAVVVGGVWWAKGKVDRIAGHERKIDELHRKADENSFTTPADGLLPEDRLLKFLDARKRMYAVYEPHKGELEALSQKKEGSIGDVTRGLSIVNDLRVAHAQALADVGMSRDEYRYFVEQVYKTMWALEVAKSTGGKSVSEAASEAYDSAAREMETAREVVEKEGAAEDQAPAELTPAEREARARQRKAAERSAEDLQKAQETLQRQSREMRERARDLDVPPANLALFRKYEADIKKYAMSGLEWIGL